MNHFLSMFVLLSIINMASEYFVNSAIFTQEFIAIVSFAYMYSQIAKGKQIKSKAKAQN